MGGDGRRGAVGVVVPRLVVAYFLTRAMRGHAALGVAPVDFDDAYFGAPLGEEAGANTLSEEALAPPRPPTATGSSPEAVMRRAPVSSTKGRNASSGGSIGDALLPTRNTKASRLQMTAKSSTRPGRKEELPDDNDELPALVDLGAFEDGRQHSSGGSVETKGLKKWWKRYAHFLRVGAPYGSNLAVVKAKSSLSALSTTWGAVVNSYHSKDLKKELAGVWQEHPRPSMSGRPWTNLNGLWNYALTKRLHDERPKKFHGTILVPFALQSNLSRVGVELNPKGALWYRRFFTFPPTMRGYRSLLHFEGADYAAIVWVNGHEVGKHKGANTPFSFDITKFAKHGRKNELVVKVTDSHFGFQLKGKQSNSRRSRISYSGSSGLWQTVWLEAVPQTYIENMRVETDITPPTILVQTKLANPSEASHVSLAQAADPVEVRVAVLDSVGGTKEIASAICEVNVKCSVNVPGARLWSTSLPHLYGLTVALVRKDGGDEVDKVSSYAGIRKIGKRKDANGNWRFTLNGNFIFHHGVLDQGWWPDGLLTPPSEEAMRSDVLYLKSAGFNTVRKHAKVEPRQFYAFCDQIGMLVWQDHVSVDEDEKSVEDQGTQISPPWYNLAVAGNYEGEKGLSLIMVDREWPPEAQAHFNKEFKGMIDTLRNHPSVVVWTAFNEAWGQHDTMSVGKMVMEYDPTRLLNVASGGNFRAIGDIADSHSYPMPKFPMDQPDYGDYVKVVGEYGGHAYRAPSDHVWDNGEDAWGYTDDNTRSLKDQYNESLVELRRLIDQGLSGSIYTQTTDVEREINGLMTYDRKVRKIDSESLLEMHSALGMVN